MLPLLQCFCLHVCWHVNGNLCSGGHHGDDASPWRNDQHEETDCSLLFSCMFIICFLFALLMPFLVIQLKWSYLNGNKTLKYANTVKWVHVQCSLVNLKEQNVSLWPKLVLQSCSNDWFPFTQCEAGLLTQIPTATAARSQCSSKSLDC